MTTKLLGCLTATAMAATVVVATPAMAFRGGGGFRGGGFHGGFGGGGFRGGMVTGRSVFVPGVETALSAHPSPAGMLGVLFAYDYAAYGNGWLLALGWLAVD